jgi:hypothetical protein
LLSLYTFSPWGEGFLWLNKGSPDEKIFTPTDERGFFPHTPHPTPYTPHPTPYTPHPLSSQKPEFLAADGEGQLLKKLLIKY